jgi:hypothetical protein
MIYFGRCDGHQLYALYDNLLITWPEDDIPWDTIRAFVSRASCLTSDDRCLAHHLPECRHIRWEHKAPYNQRDWVMLLFRRTRVNQPEEVAA